MMDPLHGCALAPDNAVCRFLRPLTNADVDDSVNAKDEDGGLEDCPPKALRHQNSDW